MSLPPALVSCPNISTSGSEQTQTAESQTRGWAVSRVIEAIFTRHANLPLWRADCKFVFSVRPRFNFSLYFSKVALGLKIRRITTSLQLSILPFGVFFLWFHVALKKKKKNLLGLKAWSGGTLLTQQNLTLLKSESGKTCLNTFHSVFEIIKMAW